MLPLLKGKSLLCRGMSFTLTLNQLIAFLGEGGGLLSGCFVTDIYLEREVAVITGPDPHFSS